MPNLGSPRVKAAMRVLGVLPKELEKLDASKLDAGRFELAEKKRRHLVASIAGLAEKGSEVSGKHGGESTSSLNNAAFMEEVLRAEKANMERMARMAKKDVQKTVLQELEAKLQWTQGQKKQQENEQRMKDFKKARAEKLKVLAKEAQKRADKNTEARARYDRQLEEHATNLTNQLNAQAEKAAAKIRDIALGREEHTAKQAEKKILVEERRRNHEDNKVNHRLKMYDDIQKKHLQTLERFDEINGLRQSNTALMDQRKQESRDRVKHHWEQKQLQTEQKYREICDRHDAAGNHRTAVAEAAMKEFRTKNNRARSQFESRYERIQTDLEKHPNLSRRLIKMQAMASSDSMQGWSSCPELKLAEIKKAAEKQGHHTWLVSENRSRISRARAHSVEQQLNKIEMMRQKTQAMLDSRATADARRMSVMRNCALAKTHFEDQVQRVKDSGPTKIITLLEEIEMEPEARARVNHILRELGVNNLPASDEEEKK